MTESLQLKNMTNLILKAYKFDDLDASSNSNELPFTLKLIF